MVLVVLGAAHAPKASALSKRRGVKLSHGQPLNESWCHCAGKDVVSGEVKRPPKFKACFDFWSVFLFCRLTWTQLVY